MRDISGVRRTSERTGAFMKITSPVYQDNPIGVVVSGERLWPPFMRRNEASAYLREVWGLVRAPATLARLACVGGGPAFRRFGRWPVYTPTDLDVWVEGRMSERKASTSAAA
jgi:hypothetical protein